MNADAEKNEFLGTQPIGSLMFRLAVPAVTAQLVNMLYNLVDRMYIGHIEGIGSLRADGRGSMYSHNTAYIRLCGACIYGRRAAAFDAYGKGRERDGRKGDGQLLYRAYSAGGSAYRCLSVWQKSCFSCSAQARTR